MKGTVKILIIFGFLIFCGALIAATPLGVVPATDNHDRVSQAQIYLAGTSAVIQRGRGSYNQAQRLIPPQHRQAGRQTTTQINIPHGRQQHLWIPKHQVPKANRYPYDHLHTRASPSTNSELY